MGEVQPIYKTQQKLFLMAEKDELSPEVAKLLVTMPEIPPPDPEALVDFITDLNDDRESGRLMLLN